VKKGNRLGDLLVTLEATEASPRVRRLRYFIVEVRLAFLAKVQVVCLYRKETC
jgi:hypothetical protein